MTKLKKNSNCDQTKKPKLWQSSNTQIFVRLKNSNCDKSQKTKYIKIQKSNCDKNTNLKLWPNSKLWQNSKNQIVIVVIVTVVTVLVRVTYFSKNNQLDTSTSVWCVQGSLLQSCDVFLFIYLLIFFYLVAEINFLGNFLVKFI